MSNGLRQEDPLRRLLEKEAVVATVNRLFRSVDEKDWDGARDCLAPRVWLDASSVAGGVPGDAVAADIVEGWRASLGELEAIHHQAGNYEVEVEGEEATASCYGIAYHYRPGASGANTRLFVGTYDLHLEKRRGGWRVDELRYDLKFTEGNPEL